jgi:pyruvate dehydrogenase E2 component (dihydrolipoamide acetyltransferase)
MEGSTFTVSNLGMFGIVEFNSIINNNSAILSVEQLLKNLFIKIWSEFVRWKLTMMLSLAYDHRTIDGATRHNFGL